MAEDNEQAARDELDSIRERIAELPSAISLAAQLNEGALERSGLELGMFHLVRAAALAATGAPSSAWEVNLELMDDHVSAEEITGMLAAIAPIIGTARYLTAVEAIVGDD